MRAPAPAPVAEVRRSPNADLTARTSVPTEGRSSEPGRQAPDTSRVDGAGARYAAVRERLRLLIDAPTDLLGIELRVAVPSGALHLRERLAELLRELGHRVVDAASGVLEGDSRHRFPLRGREEDGG